MSVKAIKRDSIPNFLKQLTGYMIIIPVEEQEGPVKFLEVEDPENTGISLKKSTISPKEHFFPRSEKLFEFQTNGVDLQISAPEKEEKEKLIFGMRSCDIKSLEILDPVFKGRPADDNYQANRENTTIISIACEKPDPTCFCNAFNIDPVLPPGADITLVGHEDSYLILENTDKGKSIIEKTKEILTNMDIELEKVIEEKKEQVNKYFYHTGISPEEAKKTLDKYFELDLWEELAQKCLACGACAYVCPTCHCFDIFDLNYDEYNGGRYRCWDTCMFYDFTRMAGGHNPRPTRKERIRNRFMHKLKYHIDRYNIEGCAGCGRCIEKCPVNIDITGVIAALEEVE